MKQPGVGLASQKGLSQTQAPQASEKLKEPYRCNPKITEAKKSKIASDVYNEILEDALL